MRREENREEEEEVKRRGSDVRAKGPVKLLKGLLETALVIVVEVKA